MIQGYPSCDSQSIFSVDLDTRSCHGLNKTSAGAWHESWKSNNSNPSVKQRPNKNCSIESISLKWPSEPIAPVATEKWEVLSNMHNTAHTWQHLPWQQLPNNISENTGVRKACSMGGMIGRCDSGYFSEVWFGAFMIGLMPQNMLQKYGYDSEVWLISGYDLGYYDSRKCNMHVVKDSVYAIFGNICKVNELNYK